MTYILREVSPADQDSLFEMLYLSIYTPPGSPAPDPAVVQQPALRRYVQDWGKPGDLGFLAVDSATGMTAGAAWLRSFPPDDPGYGTIDPTIPELGIAVRQDARSAGLGSRLLAHLIAAARRQYDAVSLSVAAANRAVRLYTRFGFQIVRRDGDTLTMVLRLDHEQAGPQVERVRSAVDVVAGRAAADGDAFGGWIVGDISTWIARAGGKMHPARFHLRDTQQVEVKWGIHPAGQQRPGGWTTPSQKVSLSILVYGEFILRFQEVGEQNIWVEHTLREEGDTLIFRETVPHTWEAVQDSIILTVRWSLSEL